jgi:hypothetical protein
MKHLVNSTLARKPGHDMKKDVGAYGINPRAKSTSQAGGDESFAFDGIMGDGVNRKKESISCANPYTIGDRALSQNQGMGPRTGNKSSSSQRLGAPAQPLTIATAAGGGPIVGTREAKCPPNANKINMGLGPRKGNT